VVHRVRQNPTLIRCRAVSCDDHIHSSHTNIR
jgi:hypothetical protein